MDLLELRVIERILAVVIGGLSIDFGYRLFIKLPEQKDSEGKMTNWKWARAISARACSGRMHRDAS
jgi:hypothetical protein